MLDHLVQFTPDVTYPETALTSAEKAGVDALLQARVHTASWLEELGVPPDKDLHEELERETARQAFSALALSPEKNTPEQHAALAALKTPESVRHLTGMLSAYDWEFVEQAKHIRGYVVAQLVEESKNPNASIRLKALSLLGKVTEIGLFTDKIEVKKTDMTDADLEARIKDKLNRFMGVVDVVDATNVAEPDEPQAPEPAKPAESRL